jgi:hypothetical protein
MGRMKEVCIQIMEENGGIPEGMTVADVARMKELEMYNWEEYERNQQETRLQFRKSENSREIEKVQQAGEIFEESIRENQEKNSEQ